MTGEEFQERMKNHHVIGFVHGDKRLMAGMILRSIPREGELIWVNQNCYEVEKVAHYFHAAPHLEEPRQSPTVVFLKDAEGDFGRFSEPDQDELNREDSLTELG